MIVHVLPTYGKMCDKCARWYGDAAKSVNVRFEELGLRNMASHCNLQDRNCYLLSGWGKWCSKMSGNIQNPSLYEAQPEFHLSTRAQKWVLRHYVRLLPSCFKIHILRGLLVIPFSHERKNNFNEPAQSHGRTVWQGWDLNPPLGSPASKETCFKWSCKLAWSDTGDQILHGSYLKLWVAPAPDALKVFQKIEPAFCPQTRKLAQHQNAFKTSLKITKDGGQR